MGRKQCETSKSQRKIILHLHNQGKSYAEIGEIMERSRFTIRNVIKRYTGSTNFENAERTGRPRKLSTRECAQIVRKVKSNPKITSTQITAEIKEAFGKDVHSKT
ncbi:PREDICTED: uncharacterized protein LOC108376890, partial [Rhagoletis zephyria]|uniref:uncharacterized protein LOC108376890 n=1 Tax=Rhagoletis zephyria TaxID=28612 RepID=UPI0008117A7D